MWYVNVGEQIKTPWMDNLWEIYGKSMGKWCTDRNPMKSIVISTINPSEIGVVPMNTRSLFAYNKPEWNWSYVHQLNAISISRGPHIDHSINMGWLAEKNHWYFGPWVYSQWIGWWENLNRKPWFLPWNIGLSCRFSLKPIQWYGFQYWNALRLGMGVTPHLMKLPCGFSSVGIGHWCQEDYFAKASK